MAIKPKLALIPSGYKGGSPKGTVYSVLPTDGVGDFDFSRPTTATRVNKDGLIETVSSNIPRLNYPMIDGVVSGCPSLLLEPARTNIGLYSEEFDNSYWTKANVSVSANDSISPDGIENADKITENTSNSAHSITRFANIPAGTYTFSVFFKYAGRRYVGLGSASGATATAIFDLQEGVIVRATEGVVIGSQMQYYGNGWYRCVVVISSGLLSSGIFLLDDSLNRSYTGDGTSSIYVWGLQLEQGSYATSYIPTSGSTVTRDAETANGAGNADTFNDSEGVLMAETKFLQDGRMGISNSDNSDQVIIGNSGGIFYRITENNSNPITQFIGVSEFENHKIALKYKSTETSIFVDGFELDTNNTTYSLSGLNELAFTAQGSSFYGNTKQLQYFDTALSDTDLEELTSWTSFNEMARDLLYTIQ